MPKIKRLVSVSQLICDALLRLIEGGRPYSEITIQEIVDEAGTCRNSFYRNFKSKEDIFQKRFLEIGDETDASEALPAHFDFYDVFKAACQKFQKHSRFFRCYYTADPKSYFDTIISHVILSNSPGRSPDISPADYYAYACRAWIGIGVITEWFLRDCDIPVDDLVEIVRQHRL